MDEPDQKKFLYKPDSPIKARLVGLAPLTVAKLAQARIKTLADMKRLTDEELKRLPLALVEYAAVKRFVATLAFEGETADGATGAAAPAGEIAAEGTRKSAAMGSENNETA